MQESPELSSIDNKVGTLGKEGDPRFSRVLIALFKGVVYQEVQEDLFYDLLAHENAVRDYVAVLGLELSLDEAEGFAYLSVTDPLEDQTPLPRMVARRPLSFIVSLVLALLRKRLVEAESSGEARLIMSREEIVEMVRVFLPERTNEAYIIDQVQKNAINRVVSLGFMRELPGPPPVYEVMRIIKAFVDAEWLADFNDKLAAYLASRG